MKKFSTGKDLKIGEKPEITNEKSESDELYYSIMELADDFLNVKYEGSVLPWGVKALPTRVEGKDLFAQALLEYLSNEDTLEKLKKILSKKVEESSQINEELRPHINKISKFLDIYGEDEGKFDIALETHVKQMENSKNAFNRHIVAEKMIYNPEYSKYSKKHLKKISEVFLNKSKELGV